MPFDIDWNDRQLVDALNEPFHQANEVLARKFQNEITSNKWAWPNPPLQRDIVKHGELRRSYVGERVGARTHSHSWNIEYGMAVHEGAVFKANSVWGRIWIAIHGKPVMPARPWTKKPIEDGTLEDAFGRLARRLLGGVK